MFTAFIQPRRLCLRVQVFILPTVLQEPQKEPLHPQAPNLYSMGNNLDPAYSDGVF
jgi:hypothetical protein